MSNTQSYPLAWPFGWPRSKRSEISSFGSHSISECVDEILRQLHLLPATNIVISTNLRVRQDGLPYSSQRQPDDPGAAVYFRLSKTVRNAAGALKGTYSDHVLACDRWRRVEDNLWAIARHVDALRGQQRWGVGGIEQAFAGYMALPPGNATADPWWDVLGVEPTANADLIRIAYRNLVKIWHPDMPGGDALRFQRIQRAYDEAMKVYSHE